MPSDGEEVASGGLYEHMEDAYYSLLDWMEQAGVPLYKFVDPFEERGIHTLPFVLIFLLLLFAGLFFVAFPQSPSDSAFTLAVSADNQPVANAVIQVYLNEELISTGKTGVDGIAKFDSLPVETLKFAVSAKNYDKFERSFDLSTRARASVELTCNAAACKAIVLKDTPTPSPTPPIYVPNPPIVTIIPPVTPTPTVSLPDPVPFSVLVRNEATGQPLQGATAELRKSGTTRVLQTLISDANGMVAFDPVEFGTKVYVIASAPGFLTYNGIAAGQQITLNSNDLSISLLLRPAVSATVNTLLAITGPNGDPVSALVEFYVNDSTTPELSQTIVGSANVSLPRGARIRARIYPSDPSFLSQTVSFNAGEPFVPIQLYAGVNPTDTPLSCAVTFDAATTQLSIRPGEKLPVRVIFSRKPKAPVLIKCDNANAYATCSGAICVSQCIFDVPGSKLVSATSGNESQCISPQVNVVYGNIRTVSLVIDNSTVALNQGFSGTITYIGLSLDEVSDMVVSCSDGKPARAPVCNVQPGQCTFQCGPYTTAGSKEITVTIGSQGVASSTVFVQQPPGCSITINPQLPMAMQLVQIGISYSYVSTVSSINVACGPRTVTASCTGRNGTCVAQCYFEQAGSFAVTAYSGSNPSCGATARVQPLVVSTTTCADDRHTPVGQCSADAPIYCTSVGTLESRASQCGCPTGWRVSPLDPNFCEKSSDKGIVGIRNGALALGLLSNGVVSNISHAFSMFNNTPLIAPVQNGIPTGADSVVAFSGGNFQPGSATGQGLISGTLKVIAINGANQPEIAAVANGRIGVSFKSVLVLASGVLFLAPTDGAGAIANPSVISQVAGVTGGMLEIVTLDGGRTSCSDGTPIGQCSTEKPFACGVQGYRTPAASRCGCPTGWMVSADDATQCVKAPTNFTSCSDGTPSARCSLLTVSFYCDNGQLKERPVSKNCGCPTGFAPSPTEDVCVPTTPVTPLTTCQDGTPQRVCSGLKPYYCDARAVLVENVSVCGCPIVGGKQFVLKNGVCVEPAPLVCADGITIPGACKPSDKPWYCGVDGSSFSSNASVCGCPTLFGVQLVADANACILRPPDFCPDGVTQRNSCKFDAKPMYCRGDAGGYIEKASVCGCPATYLQLGDSCVPDAGRPSCSVDVFPKYVSPGVPAKMTILVSGFSSVPFLSQINAVCDLYKGTASKPNLSYNSAIGAFNGDCVYSPVQFNESFIRPFIASIGAVQCSSSLPALVRVKAIAPTSCDVFGTPVNTCVVGRPPSFCKLSGSEYDGFTAGVVDNASVCNCPANMHQSNDGCLSNDLPTLCYHDNTTIGQCSSSIAYGKPFKCKQPDSTNKYNTTLEPDAATCGCPASMMRNGNNCVNPTVGVITVSVPSSLVLTTQAISGLVKLSGFNFPVLQYLQANPTALDVACADSDGSGAGQTIINMQSCSAVAQTQFDVTCPLQCIYPAGLNGTKRVVANLSFAQTWASGVSMDFAVAGWPAGNCSITSDNQLIRLGQRVVYNVTFNTPFDASGARQVFQGSSQQDAYRFSCGAVASPLGGLVNLTPVTTLNCVGSSGVCKVTCEYNSTSIDVNKTSETAAVFEGFPNDGRFRFSCPGPTVSITDLPAVVRVTVKHAGNPVAGADVTLYEVVSGGASQVCSLSTTNASGIATFAYCESSDGSSRRTILQNSFMRAYADISVSDSGANSVAMSNMTESQKLVVSNRNGVNDIDANIDFDNGKVAASAIDALTRTVTENLTKASFFVRCPSVDLTPTPHLSATSRQVGNCTGSSCIAQSKALLSLCTVAAGAPGYANDTYTQTRITSNTPGASANTVVVAASLVPLSFTANSLYEIYEVIDVEGATVIAGDPLPLSDLKLKKGFRYIVKAKLRTLNTSDRVAMYFQASPAKASYIYSNSFPDLYIPEYSSGQRYEDNSQCGYAEVNYIDPPQPRYYDWLELQAINNFVGGRSLSMDPNNPVEVAYHIMPNDQLEGNASSLRARSFTYNSRTLPNFVVSPFDAGALNSSNYARIPFCSAAANEVPYALLESVRACSSDYGYCLTNTFSQPGVSPDSRGDGFVAQSALLCGPSNEDHCVNVTSSFKIRNNELAGGNASRDYFLSIAADPARYQLVEVRFAKPGSNTTILRALGDLSVVTSRTSGSMVIDLFTLSPRLGGLMNTADLAGTAILKPLYPTEGEKTFVNITYSSSSKTVKLNQYTFIVPRSGVHTKYGQVWGSELVRQLEQADYEVSSFGYGQYHFGAFSNTTAFNASSWDCTGGEKGWPCQYVQLSNFNVTLYQNFQDASIIFNDPSGAFVPVYLSYNVVGPTGSVLQSFDHVSVSGLPFKYSVGPLNVNERLSVVLYLKPPVGAAQNRLVVLGVINGSVENTTLAVNGLLSSRANYGKLKITARDALDSRVVNGTKFNIYYAGNVNTIEPCILGADDSCVYRLKPISWTSACPFVPNGEAAFSGAGCVNVSSVPQGYFSAPAQKLFEDKTLGGTCSTAECTTGSIVAGRQNNMTLFLLKPVSSPSAIQLIEIRRSDNGDVACRSGAAGQATAPDCITQPFALTKGVVYTIALKGSMKESDKGGLFFAAGHNTDEARLVTVPSSLQVSGGTSVPIIGYSASGSTDACAVFVQGATPLLTAGANWMQLVSNNLGAGDFGFDSSFQFLVPASYSGEFVDLQLNSFVANRSNLGKEFYFRSPVDDSLGYDFENEQTPWCKAKTIKFSPRAVDSSTLCNGLACISMDFEQGSAQSSAIPNGFAVTSRKAWETWYSDPYPKVKLNFKINVIANSPDKRITLSADPAQFKVTDMQLTQFCGLGAQGLAGASTATGYSFDASGCLDVNASSDIEGFLLADAAPSAVTLPQNASVTLSYLGGGKRSDYATWLQVTDLDTVNKTNFASVTVDAMQRQVTSQGSIPLRSTIVCSPLTGSCSSTRFYSTFGNDCTQLGIDNAFNERGTPYCAASWIELSYNIISSPHVDTAKLSFELPSGDALIPDLPTSSILTDAAYIQRNVEGTLVKQAIRPDSSGKFLNTTVSNVRLGEALTFVVRVNPRRAGAFRAVMRFNNGQETSLSLVLTTFGKTVTSIACPGPACPDIMAVFPCGRADLLFSVASDTTGRNLRIVPSCNTATLLIDPIFPADALPITFDNSFIASCTAGRDPITETDLYKFDPIYSGRPAGSRMLAVTDLKIDRTTRTIMFDGRDFGLNHQKIFKGNMLTWPGENASITAGEEIGRINLVLSCPAAQGATTNVTVILKANTLGTQGPDGSELSLLNAIDASGVFFHDQAHQLAWALYNGQFPMTLSVQASNEERVMRIPFDPYRRVQYILTNQPNAALDMAGSYPYLVYPSQQAEPLPAPFGRLDSTIANNVGGVVVTDPAHRPGNLMSGLVAEAHGDPETNAAFKEFLNSTFNPDTPNSCQAISYVSQVYKQLPLAFKSFAQKIAFETAFRRTRKPDELLFCAYAKLSPPFYCNANQNIVLSPSQCGCPAGFWKSADGNNCEPITALLNPPTKCADGTLPGACSTVGGYRCTANTLVLVSDSSCQVPSGLAPGKCYGGTPINSCLRDNTRSLVCFADVASWKAPNIEVETVVQECTGCAPVAAPYVAAYVPSGQITLLASTVSIGTGGFFPPGSTAATANGTEVFDNVVNITSVFTADADPQQAPRVQLQYQRASRTDCSPSSSNWCSDTRLFEAGDSPQISYVGTAPGGLVYSKFFPLNVQADSSDFIPGAGTWVIRAAATFVDRNGAMQVIYSVPRQVVVAQRVRACLDRAGETAFSCSGTDANAWCNANCVGGKARIAVRAGPGVLSGEANVWLNATPIESMLVPNVTGIDNYNGTPFSYFINPATQPFSLSFPLMTWSSEQVPEWNSSSQFTGYQMLSSACGEGIGFYELQAISPSGGRNDWRYTSRLASLPLQNYFLNTEPSDKGNFNPSNGSYGYLGGDGTGCQMHSENPAWDWSVSNKSGRPTWWSGPPLLQPHEKPLCNINMRAVTVHVHECNGQCDCVLFNNNRFGGNCACPLPGCDGRVGMPACGTEVNTTVCPDANCISVSRNGKPACACTQEIYPDVCSKNPSTVEELNATFGTTKGYICDLVSPSKDTYVCPAESCSLADNPSGITPTCICPTQIAAGCTQIPEKTTFVCPVIRTSGAGGLCNPVYCKLAEEPAGCSSGPIVIAD